MLLQHEIRQPNLHFTVQAGGRDTKKEKYFFIKYIDLRRRIGNNYSKHYISVQDANENSYTVKCNTDDLDDLYCPERLGVILGIELTWDINDNTKHLIQSLNYNYQSDDCCLNISYFNLDRRTVQNVRIGMGCLGHNRFFNFDAVEMDFRRYFINL